MNASLLRRLSRSHLLVAAIGFFALGGSLVGILRFRHEALDLASRVTPAATAVGRASSALQRTGAALRGYLSVQDPALRATRKRAWDELWRAIDALTPHLNAPETERLLRDLRSLEEAQWYVEDVAGTPAARPAADYYAGHAEPLALRAIGAVNALVHMQRRHAKGGAVAALADLRYALLRSLAASRAWLNGGDAIDAQDAERAAASLPAALARLPGRGGPEAREQVELAREQVRAYLLAAAEAARLHTPKTADVARDLLKRRAMPVARRLTDSFAELSARLGADAVDAEQVVRSAANRTTWLVIVLLALLLLTTPIVARRVAVRLTRPIRALADATAQLAEGAHGEDLPVEGDAELADLTRSFNVMRRRITEATRALQDQLHAREALARVDEAVRTQRSVQDLGRTALRCIAEELGAVAGALSVERDGALRPVASYGLSHIPEATGGFALDALRDGRRRVVEDLPAGYLALSSATGTGEPRALLVAPLDLPRSRALVELASFAPFDPAADAYLDAALAVFAVGLAGSLAREDADRLHARTREQADELEAQAEELRATNEELTNQQAELRAANEELEEQRELILQRSEALRSANEEVARQASAAEEASRYKSEFLANMSHELRTPLNSLLILARDLQESDPENLRPGQLEAAQIIHQSGRDLLQLINDILDLSKVEAGHLEVHPAATEVDDVLAVLRRTFDPVAQQKGLLLTLERAPGGPATLTTDSLRLEQILRNLLANALKFTERGEVSLTVSLVGPEVVFAVRDTGIGIPEERLEAIFEAFRQVDGTITRRFGGTGLGLSISQRLAELLGGRIAVESTVGEGSCFSLRLPSPQASAPPAAGTPPPLDFPPVEDDRASIGAGDRVLLVVEDDPVMARRLRDLARGRRFKCLVTHTGEEALTLATSRRPTAIVLDHGLPGISGLGVLEALKQTPETAKIPVHVVSAADLGRDPVARGAVSFLRKPLDEGAFARALDATASQGGQGVRRVLLVEDDLVTRRSVRRALASSEVELEVLERGEEALRLLSSGRSFDCLVLDLELPDADGIELLERLQAEGVPTPPTIVHTARELTAEQDARLAELAQSVIVKGARSQERLIDETALFLRRVSDEHPPKPRPAPSPTLSLEGRRILVVDDDMRGAFALARVLTQRGAETTVAENGRQAIERLEEGDFDLVLMDMMMPEMDGLEATRRIRQTRRPDELPIISVTAKAMAEDRAACLEAGANDYLPKPVDTDRLLSVLGIWLGARDA